MMLPELFCWWDLHWRPPCPPVQPGSISSWFKRCPHHRCSLRRREAEGLEDLELKTSMELWEAGMEPPAFPAVSQSDGPAGVAVGSVTISGGGSWAPFPGMRGGGAGGAQDSGEPFWGDLAYCLE